MLWSGQQNNCYSFALFHQKSEANEIIEKAARTVLSLSVCELQKENEALKADLSKKEHELSDTNAKAADLGKVNNCWVIGKMEWRYCLTVSLITTKIN